jgi:hypothetical protein
LEKLAHSARRTRVVLAALRCSRRLSGIPGADFSAVAASAAGPPAQVGAGRVKVARSSAVGAGELATTAQSMRNAAEMASPIQQSDIQLLVKDDGGSGPGAQQAAEQALAEGAEIILGPLFAQSVSAAGQVARARGVPVIAFSTDAGVAAPGVYLLSFLPESEVDRVIGYAMSHGKRSFAALIHNAYGRVQAAPSRPYTHGAAWRDGVARLTRPDAGVQRARRRAQVDAIFSPLTAPGSARPSSRRTASGVPRHPAPACGRSELNAEPGAQGAGSNPTLRIGFPAATARAKTGSGAGSQRSP